MGELCNYLGQQVGTPPGVAPRRYVVVKTKLEVVLENEGFKEKKMNAIKGIPKLENNL